MSILYWVLAAVAVQRLVEVAIARRNEARLKSMGGIEYAAGHYPLIVLLHAAWLAAMAVFVPASAPTDWTLLSLFGVLQIARYWVIATLGRPPHDTMGRDAVFRHQAVDARPIVGAAAGKYLIDALASDLLAVDVAQSCPSQAE